MAENLAKIVSKDNIIKAIENIDLDNRNLHASTKFDIVFRGKRYPPKEVIREAAKLQGINDWYRQDKYRLNGGESVNRYLKNKGFDVQSKISSTRYFIGGAMWDNVDQSPNFINNRVWKNGYKDQFIEEVRSVPVGSFIALKSSWADAKTKQDYLRIKGIGEVISNPGDGITLEVNWDEDFKQYDIPGLSGYRKTFHEITNELHINKIFNHEEEENDSMNVAEGVTALNTILYGPPGTGKTYKTIDLACQIVAPHIYQKYKQDRTQLTQEFRNLLITDWKNAKGQIAFVTFHQSLSYEDFIEGIKPTKQENSSHVHYEVIDGIFKKICKEANKTEQFTATIDDETKPLTIELFEEFYYSFSGSLPSVTEEKSEIVLKTPDGYPFELFQNSVNSIVVKAGSKRTNQSVAFSELKAVLFEKKVPTYKSYATQIIKKILEDKGFTKTHAENSNKKYVLIIDEINRGNVSQIFGELITLIEDGKRSGDTEEISVTLPYSREVFSVPSNLYIIGTMNTADRSVEALDTALRRRFSFVEMQADAEHDDLDRDASISGQLFSFAEVLATINKRLEKLVGRDHQIGHSYFLPKAEWTWEHYLFAFTNKIIPLLQEYFYGDYAKMCLVVGKGFVDLQPEPNYNEAKFFAAAEHEALDSLLEKQVWRIQSINTEAEFANALNLLLNK